ncbi:MAG: hypothetical protein A3I29_03070 [Candidatus Magasanikbacteria bacterium RIFCSPLOWO2_02_FULL_44_11]|uniref:Uncharacterized protein n=1 Tax=Candidatus Magasanikbacteria bacterium RIFCSPLOWO2_02_FULL_44_11 TaxID=1798689 RepID=A0A1F6N948_9BACT|nr:MAG: hypothetical protein A3I29_03070 [Candidatus Magasanikbacteria bacterium RIFCSPLOWO2_02_FULL_44_11]
MIKHTDKTETDKLLNSAVDKGAPVLEQSMVSGLEKKGDQPSLKELLEKNLKWSQIIYEQNRKINNKLLWSAVANWLRLLIIVVPFILAIIYLPAIIKNFKDQYMNFLGASQSGKASSVEDIINLLPINSAERERVKALLK